MRTTNETFKERLERARENLKFIIQDVILDFTEQIQRRLSSLGINKAEFAKRLNASPAYVTKMLKGDTNFTIETMVKVARSLDSELEIRMCPRNAGSEWFCSESVIIVSENYAREEFRPSSHKGRWQGAEGRLEFRRQTVLSI